MLQISEYLYFSGFFLSIHFPVLNHWRLVTFICDRVTVVLVSFVFTLSRAHYGNNKVVVVALNLCRSQQLCIYNSVLLLRFLFLSLSLVS